MRRSKETLAVYDTSMIYTNNEHQKDLVVNLLDDSVFSNPNPPSIFRSLQREASRWTRIVGQFMNRRVDPFPEGPRQPFHLPARMRHDFDAAGHLQAQFLTEFLVGYRLLSALRALPYCLVIGLQVQPVLQFFREVLENLEKTRRYQHGHGPTIAFHNHLRVMFLDLAQRIRNLRVVSGISPAKKLSCPLYQKTRSEHWLNLLYRESLNVRQAPPAHAFSALANATVGRWC